MVLFVIAIASCSSGGAKSEPVPPSTGSTRAKSALSLSAVREVGGLFTPRIFRSSSAACSKLPTGAPKGSAILFDRKHAHCYAVGPTLLTGSGVAKSVVAFDSNNSYWVVIVHWSNDDFLTKVAHPLVNHTVAIVLDGVVQSAPVINPGITGRDVEISDRYSRYQAVAVAASIMRVAPSAIEVNSEG